MEGATCCDVQMHWSEAEKQVDRLVHQREDQVMNCDLEVVAKVEQHQEQEQERLSECKNVGAPDFVFQGLCCSGSLGNVLSAKGAACKQVQDRA